MNKKLRKIIEEKTISLEEFSKDFTDEQKRISENFTKYYSILLELRKLRKELGLTQAQLAKKAGLPRTTITKIESGAYNPTLNTLMQLASAMNKKLQVKLV